MRSIRKLFKRPVAVISALLILLLLLAMVSPRSQAKDPPEAEAAADNLGVDRETFVPEPTPLDAVVFDQPMAESPAWLANLFCPLPARVEMLAIETPNDEETEKLQQLRESYEELLKEKAALLNADALSAEIELQRRQVTELKALRELQKLQQSLKELSDKFPNSEAGKRALEVLDLLKQRSGPPGLHLLPTPDEGFRSTPAPAFLPNDPARAAPPSRIHPAGDVPIPRRKPMKLEEQPIRPKPVPNPTDEEKRPIP